MCMSPSLLSLFLTLVISVLGQNPQEQQLLAMEVRFHGDAEPWRWWCRAPEDPLAEDVIQGFAEGFKTNQGGNPIIALPTDTAAVHPMYCTEPLDNDLAMNLAGLLDATVNHSGLIEVGAIVQHADPKVLTTEISFYPFTEGVYSAPTASEEEERDADAGNIKDAHERGEPLVTRTAIALSPSKLSSSLREAARSLGKTVFLLRLKEMKSRGSDRQLWFFVRGIKNQTRQMDLAARLQALFPTGYEMSILGFKGDNAAFILEAPAGRSSDLLGMLQARIGASTAGLPPLLLEGFDKSGFPLFVTVDTEAPAKPSEKDPMFP